MGAIDQFIKEEKDWLAPSKRFGAEYGGGGRWTGAGDEDVDAEDDDQPGLTSNKHIPRTNAIDENTP